MPVNPNLISYLDKFSERGAELAFARRRGLRTFRWSGEDVAFTAHQFSYLLESRQVVKGDRVLLCGWDGPEWIAAFFGCLLRGAVVVPLEVQSEASFVARVQQQVKAKLAVFDTRARKSFCPDLPVVKLEELTEFRRPALTSSHYVQFSEDETAEVVFTSGTTAEPKGVVITHGNLLANLQPLEQQIRPYLKWERLVHPIRFLNLLPLSHIFGQFMGIFVPQLLGGPVFFSDSAKPSEIIQTVKSERISVIICVPRMLEILREQVLRHYEARNKLQDFVESVESAQEWNAARRWWEFCEVHRLFGFKFWAFISGGATLSAETEAFWQRLGFAVIQGYGMTETAALISLNHPFKLSHGSIGKVMRGQSVQLSDKGEILVRGANVFRTYWQSEGGRLVRGDEGLDQQGWFHTGDVGELDAEGNLYFKGRMKEVIVTASGLNVYPTDLEEVLNVQPEIKVSAVVGIEGPRGPEPVAALILRDKKVDVKVLIERANKSLAESQKIRRWFVWPEEDFPRTATQKIRKQLIAESIKAGSEVRAAGSHSSELAQLLTRLSGESRTSVEPSAKLGTELKLDSLGRVELLSLLEERYQVEINEADFSADTTVGDVEQIIRDEKPGETSSYPYPHWPHRWPISWLRIVALYLIVFPLVRIMGRMRVKGLENLIDQTKPLLFIANHLTIVDHALILGALSGRFRRRMSIAMDGEILRDWLYPPRATNWLTRLRYRIQFVLVAFFFNVFAMPQHSGFRRSFAFAGQMMDRGYSVLVFPEGRRSPDGKLQQFRSGIGLLATQLNASIVPIRIQGLHELARQGRHFAPKGAITIVVGKVIKPDDEQTPREITANLEKWFNADAG